MRIPMALFSVPNQAKTLAGGKSVHSVEMPSVSYRFHLRKTPNTPDLDGRGIDQAHGGTHSAALAFETVQRRVAAEISFNL
jgi:hypothetical protein